MLRFDKFGEVWWAKAHESRRDVAKAARAWFPNDIVHVVPFMGRWLILVEKEYQFGERPSLTQSGEGPAVEGDG